MKIYPLTGLKVKEGVAKAVSTPPYDVVTREEALGAAEDNPLSFFHISRADVDLRPSIHPHDPEVYRQAAANFSCFQKVGVFEKVEPPSFYVYGQQMNEHWQYGLYTLLSVDDYLDNVIKKHEKTRQDKEEDRLELQTSLRTQSGPVFLMYRDDAAISKIIGKATLEEPEFSFTTEDKVTHAIWLVPKREGEFLEKLFHKIPAAYIADGHHRAAAAVRYCQQQRSLMPNYSGLESFNWFMGVLFPASQLTIYAYNRLVADLNDLSYDAFIQRVGEVCVVEKLPPHTQLPGQDLFPSQSTQKSPNRFHLQSSLFRRFFKNRAPKNQNKAPNPCPSPISFFMYTHSTWHKLTFPVNESPLTDFTTPSSLIEQLAVSVLQNKILGPILGIHDPRISPRISFVGGIKGSDYLMQQVDSHSAAAAFLMPPISADTIMTLADNSQIMPPKSTWFEPKLRCGFFLHVV
ncbi:MAG: hypothetical protein A2007_04105 [Verrucomicrobia bacterium GWC2_42_7]|nr:MAG: hypothetical protein A2007_04105 [Verrucomicrobia bacterium GWC2_42_7]